MSIRHVQIFVNSQCEIRKSGKETRWTSVNNLVLKALFDPIVGAGFGLLVAELFLDAHTGLLKVSLLGLVGGMLWQHVVRKLPDLLNITKGGDG